MVYYVGETGKRFEQRMHEHFGEFAGARYHVYEAEAFARGKKILLWPGKYDRENRKTAKECTDIAPSLSGTIEQLSQKSRFLVAPLDTDKRTRCRVEAAIARTLQDAPNPAHRFQEAGVNYARRRKEEEPFECLISSQVPILGLPDEGQTFAA
jgi:hypothetical protein